MIESKLDLKEYISLDNDFLHSKSLKAKAVSWYAHYPVGRIRTYLKLLRLQEYYINSAHGSKLKGILAIYYERKKNRLGERLGIEIGPNCFGKGLSIWHYGAIIVNTEARIGDFCTLHGANCIGNNGKESGVPKIGNHVDIGYGAVVIGDITIADYVKIGANAVVTKSINTPGCTVVGIPGRILRD